MKKTLLFTLIFMGLMASLHLLAHDALPLPGHARPEDWGRALAVLFAL